MSNTATATEKGFNIIVNGRPKAVTLNVLSFADVVKLAYENAPFGANTAYTVTYRNSADHKQGSLVEGGTVEVRNGTIFNVSATNQS
jgi:hypothetical protein